MFKLVLVLSVFALLSVVECEKIVRKRSPISDDMMASLIGSGV
nr:venom polypeptide precursor [Doratifera vulnerans]